MSKKWKNVSFSFCFFFHFYCLPPSRFQFREESYVSWRLAYKNQVCIAYVLHGSRRWCLASLYGEFSIVYRALKINNFISVSIETQVSIWFLISICTRIINKIGEYEIFEIANLDTKLKTWTDLLKIGMCPIFMKFGTQNKSNMVI